MKSSLLIPYTYKHSLKITEFQKLHLDAIRNTHPQINGIKVLVYICEKIFLPVMDLERF